jgi:hypothetical protein
VGPDAASGGIDGLRALIVFVPHSRVPSVPPIALDALAQGVLVIMRSSDAWQLLPPKLVAYAGTPEQAAGQIAWCMTEGTEQRERVRAGRTATRNAHTYAARLATVASSVGLTLLPEPAG